MPLELDTLDTRRHLPIAHWIWDCDPTDAILEHQLSQLRIAGFGGVCIQPMPDDFRPGDFPRRMKTPYLSDDFFSLIKNAVEKAAQHNLTVWLYDEGGWPSGQATGRVLQGHPHLQGQTLVYESGRFIVEPTGLPDPLKLQAMNRFMQLTHLRYEQAVGRYFGSTIEAMFTDELKLPGHIGTDRIPWTDDLPQQFHQRAGYELQPILSLLFEGHLAHRHPQAAVTKARSDFARVCMELFIERCFAPQQQWCQRNNLLFTGHLAGDQDIARHPAIFGDYMAVMRTHHMPGIDTIWRQIWPGHVADFPLLAGSAREIHQRDFAMSETAAVYGRDMSVTQLRWVTNHQIMRGINRFTIMSLPTAGDDTSNISGLNLQSPWWEAYKPWADHTALLSALTSLGRPAPTVAVLYPATDLMARGGNSQGTIAQAIVETLTPTPASCLYLDEQAILQGNLSHNTSDKAHATPLLTAGHATFHTLVLAGGSLITHTLAAALTAHAAAGLRIFAIGETLPFYLNDKKEKHTLSCASLLSFEELAASPLQLCPPSHPQLYTTAAPRVRSVTRFGDAWQLLIFFNEDNAPATITLNLPPAIASTARCYTIDTTLQPLDCNTHDSFTLLPGQTIAITTGNIRIPSNAAEKHVQPLQPAATPTLSNWQLASITDDKNQPLDTTTSPATAASPHTPWATTLGQYFSGSVTWQATFELPSTAFDASGAPSPLILDLGQVQHIASVTINGNTLDARSFHPWRFDLTPHLKPGHNTLRVTITNMPGNALWEPAHVQHLKDTRQWNIYNVRITQRCQPALDGGWPGPIQWLTK